MKTPVNRASSLTEAIVPDARNADLTDQQLRGRSRYFGMSTREARRRFLATLPELDRRGLVTKRYGSIFAYAAQVGGARRDQVLGALSLARRLTRFPKVWALFESGEVGRAVLVRIPVELMEGAEDSWVRHLKTLSKSQIEALVASEQERRRGPESALSGSPENLRRPMRGAESRMRAGSRFAGAEGLPGHGLAGVDAGGLPGHGSAGVDAGGLPGQGSAGVDAGGLPEHGSAGVDVGGLLGPGVGGVGTGGSLGPGGGDAGAGGLPGRGVGDVSAEGQPGRGAAEPAKRRVIVELSEDEYARLLVAQRERAAQAGRPVSMGETLREGFLENYLDTRPPGEVDVDGGERAALEKRAVSAAEKAGGDRIPVPVKRFVRVRSAGRCERPGCRRPGEHFHHQIKARARRKRLPLRLRDLPRHHPDALVHLCGDCHGLVHEGMIQDPFAPARKWVLRAVDSPRRRDAQDRKFGLVRRRARSG